MQTALPCAGAVARGFLAESGLTGAVTALQYRDLRALEALLTFLLSLVLHALTYQQVVAFCPPRRVPCYPCLLRQNLRLQSPK